MSLYLKHFGLKREPFSIVPDPGFLYPSEQHRQAVAHLKYGLDREGGFILLTGEVGTGKTTLTRTLLKSMPAHFRVAYVLNSQLEVGDLLASICHELDIELPESRGLSFTKKCTDALYSDLLTVHANGKKTLIVIEEAQNLSAEILETLRLLSNLETHTDKLLHILLVAQPEFLDILAQKTLRQLNQRVVARFHLQPLEKNDIANYVNHRLHRAGAQRSIFDDRCMPILHRLTGGVPRLINLVCQHALLAGYATGSDRVSGALLKNASTEILAGPRSPSQALRGRVLVVILTALCALGVGVQTGVIELTRWALPAVVHDVDEPSDAQILHHSNTAEELLFEGESVNQTKSDANIPVANIADTRTPEPPELILENSANVSGTEETERSTSSAPPFSVEGGLLERWSVSQSMVRSQAYEAIAEASGLRIEKLVNTDFETLLSINRPGLVSLQARGVRQKYMLVGVFRDTVRLMGVDGIETRSVNNFLDLWDAEYHYLWRPPPQFSVLQRGISNRRLLQWLQASLLQIDDQYEWIISGGRYTEAIYQQVIEFQRRYRLRTDGLVGRETSMMINQLTDPNVPILYSGNL